MVRGVLHFGVFEVDVESRELRRHGLRVKIQDKPFQLLVALIERPGELVTREELRQRLWSAQTFVDFDRSINIAVTKLRLALGDSSDNPRFVETVPRRGFRFIAPVANRDLRPARSQAWPLPGSAPSSPLAPTHPQSTESDGTASALSAHPPRAARDERTPGGRAPLTARRGVVVSTAVASIVFALLVRMEFFAHGARPPELPAWKQLTNDGYVKSGFATDRSRLYLVEEVDGTRRLAQVEDAGGDVVPIATPLASPAGPSISPDRSHLLLIDFRGYGSGDLWILSLVSGGRRRVGDVKAYAATWSPDGRNVAYADGGSLFVVGSDGARTTRLATLPGSVSYIRWSPDGQRLRFSLAPPDGRAPDQLREIRADGSNLRRVLAEWRTGSDKCCGDWTRDGKDFVFQVRDDARWDIWAAPERAGFLSILKSRQQPVRLTHGPLDYRYPEPSADGKRIFVVGREDREALSRYDGALKQFVPYLHGMSADQVDFSRDGEWITYVSYPARTLWRNRTDGSEPLQLTLPSLRVARPRWSPDGRWIAFMGKSSREPWKIHVVRSAGGSYRRTVSTRGDASGPTWSPDGSSLLFTDLLLNEVGDTERSIIHKLNLKSGAVSDVPGSSGLWSARYSPDGRYIAALTTDSRTVMLFTCSVGKWTPLLTTMPISDLEWSHSGEYLYYRAAPFRKTASIFRIRIADRSASLVAKLKADTVSASRWFGLAPDDSPIIAGLVGSQEIYSLRSALP